MQARPVTYGRPSVSRVTQTGMERRLWSPCMAYKSVKFLLLPSHEGYFNWMCLLCLLEIVEEDRHMHACSTCDIV